MSQHVISFCTNCRIMHWS